jgi:hypothetical protein
MKRNYYSRKLRQFKNVNKQLNQLLNKEVKPLIMVRNLSKKLKLLFNDLNAVFGKSFLKKSIAGSTFALSFLFGNSLNAQSFSAPVTSPFNFPTLDLISKCAVYDIDSDGDKDIMAVAYVRINNIIIDSIKRITFVENIGNSNTPLFTNPVYSPFGLQEINASIDEEDAFLNLTLNDIDNDGDLDLFYGVVYNSSNNNIAFSENIGTPTNPIFDTFVSNPFNISFTGFTFNKGFTPSFVDIDDDSDFDLFVGNYTSTILYFENVGSSTSPLFAEPLTNVFNINTNNVGSTLTFSDLDGDGDYDLLNGTFSNVSYVSQFEYLENIGTNNNANFSTSIVNPFGLGSNNEINLPSNFADMDNDGDQDLFTYYYIDNIQYYENISNIGASIKENNSDLNVSIYPIPCIDKINLNYNGNKSEIKKITLFDLKGNVLVNENNFVNYLDLSKIEKGFYFIEIIENTGKKSITKIQKS